MRVAVVGGGISGLAAAHRLTELAAGDARPLELTLFEGSGRLGGVIGTSFEEQCVLEWGPDSIITDKPWGMALIKRLGLEPEVVGTQDAHRRSFVVKGGSLHPVPEGFQILAPTRFGPLIRTGIFSPLGKARMALDLILPRRQDPSDESLGDFVLRRLGREALDRMAQPMIGGIYGGDPMTLSLEATLPRFQEMERQHGSVIRGMWARSRASGHSPKSGVSGARYGLFAAFRNGMQTLVTALEQRIGGASIQLNTAVSTVWREGADWRMQLADGNSQTFDRVIVAMPSCRSASLVETVSPELSRLLRTTGYGSSATMSLLYQAREVSHPLNGFGFVVPRSEGLTLLGCTFTHRKYPNRAPDSVALLRAFLGGSSVTTMSNVELEASVRDDLRRVLGLTATPFRVVIHRQHEAMAQYPVGHLKRVDEMDARVAQFPGLALAGNGFRGIGIPDCIHRGELAAEAVWKGGAE